MPFVLLTSLQFGQLIPYFMKSAQVARLGLEGALPRWLSHMAGDVAAAFSSSPRGPLHRADCASSQHGIQVSKHVPQESGSRNWQCLKSWAWKQTQHHFCVFYLSKCHRVQIQVEGSKTPPTKEKSIIKFCSPVFKLPRAFSIQMRRLGSPESSLPLLFPSSLTFNALLFLLW